MYLSKYVFISLEYISPGNGFSGLQGNFMLNTLRIVKIFYKVAAPFYIPTSKQYRKTTNSEHLH